MNKIGILASDLSAFYVVGQLHLRYPHMAMDIIYDPIGYFESRDATFVDQYLKENQRRFKALDIDEPIIAREKWTSSLPHWEGFVKKIEEKIDQPYLKLKSHGQDNVVESPLLFQTAEDGLLQRNYTLYILQAYLDKVPKDCQNLILASPSYGYWKQVLVLWARENKVGLYDPMDQVFSYVEEEKRPRGALRFFWTQRDFALERRVREILQEPICFSTFYFHPWLRGEKKKKRWDLHGWLEEKRAIKKL